MNNYLPFQFFSAFVSLIEIEPEKCDFLKELRNRISFIICVYLLCFPIRVYTSLHFSHIYLES